MSNTTFTATLLLLGTIIVLCIAIHPSTQAPSTLVVEPDLMGIFYDCIELESGGSRTGDTYQGDWDSVVDTCSQIVFNQ